MTPIESYTPEQIRDILTYSLLGITYYQLEQLVAITKFPQVAEFCKRILLNRQGIYTPIPENLVDDCFECFKELDKIDIQNAPIPENVKNICIDRQDLLITIGKQIVKDFLKEKNILQ